MVNPSATARQQLQIELAAKAVIAAHRRSAFDRTFNGTELIKKRSSIAADAMGLKEAGFQFAGAVAQAAGSAVPDVVGAVPIFPAINLVLKIVGIEDSEKDDFNGMFAEELAVLTANGILGVASLFTPYISTVIAGRDMAREWIMTAVEGHKSYQLQRSIPCDVLPGDPLAAAKAVRLLISRNAGNHARLATIHSAKFAVDVAATAGGFGAGGAAAGAVTGAASAGAQLANTLFLLGRDYHEMKVSNALLKGGVLPSSEALFGAYPLLGCYLIVGADDSDLLHFFMSEMGTPGWMDKVEQQKKRTLGPLQMEARKFIDASRFELNGFSGSKLVMVPKKKSAKVRLASFAHRVFVGG
jgi:hypothetical protein